MMAVLPNCPPFTEAQVQAVIDEFKIRPHSGRNTVMALLETKNTRAVAKLVRKCKQHLGLDPTDKRNHIVDIEEPMTTPENRLKIDMRPDEIVIEGTLPGERYRYAETVPHLLDAAEVDTDKWEVARKVINRWGSSTSFNWQVKAWLRPKEVDLLQALVDGALETLKERSPVMPPLELDAQRDETKRRRALEISIVDPHLGGLFCPPASEQVWTLERCARLWHHGVDAVLRRAAPFGPFERILFFLGHDFMHADNVFHTTTAGTGQPEMAAIHHVAVFGEQLLIETVDQLARHAHVDVKFVPGNHARWTEFMLARCVLNRFWNNDRVHVDAEPTPYKGWRYGVNLIGGEHGHSAQAIRLAAVMANEWPEWWAATAGGYREWHLGDQHRAGKATPLIYEEQGVSVQGLPGLTPANEWHKIKTFSRQKRVAATGFVWDYDEAKLAELPICIDGVTGEAFGHGDKS